MLNRINVISDSEMGKGESRNRNLANGELGNGESDPSQNSDSQPAYDSIHNNTDNQEGNRTQCPVKQL